jgi:hypothetical protein
MFLTKKNSVRDQFGRVIQEGICFDLFIGIDILNKAYKSIVCMRFPERSLLTISPQQGYFVVNGIFYNDLFHWVEENLSDIKISSNLFNLPVIVKVEDEEKIVEIRDILYDETIKRQPCCTADFLTTRLELVVESLM